MLTPVGYLGQTYSKTVFCLSHQDRTQRSAFVYAYALGMVEGSGGFSVPLARPSGL